MIATLDRLAVGAATLRRRLAAPVNAGGTPARLPRLTNDGSGVRLPVNGGASHGAPISGSKGTAGPAVNDAAESASGAQSPTARVRRHADATDSKAAAPDGPQDPPAASAPYTVSAAPHGRTYSGDQHAKTRAVEICFNGAAAGHHRGLDSSATTEVAHGQFVIRNAPAAPHSGGRQTRPREKGAAGSCLRRAPRQRCRRGHVLDPRNVEPSHDGKRRCAECRRAAQRRAYARAQGVAS